AIPSNMAKHVMDQLVANGTVRRAKLGVTVQRITADMAASLGLASAQGALVSNVEEGSAAARAGLKQGDVITQYNGKAVADNNQLRNAVAATTPGTSVQVEVLRSGRTESLQATVGELAARKEAANAPADMRGEGKYGMSIQPLTPDLAESAGVPRTTQGVMVADLDPSGIAAESGLQEGDVIEKVDGKAVRSAADLKGSLDRNDGKASLLLINRKGTAIFLTLAAR
ncbi:MAG: PDZ domain-containing protein, partial [Vicinamibacterales bacterium]